MNRKVWIVILATTAVLILNNWHPFGYGKEGDAIDFILTLVVIYQGYKRYKKVDRELNNDRWLTLQPQPVTVPAINARQAAGPGFGLSPVWTILLIFLAIFLFAGYQLIAAASFNFFVWGDHIFSVTNGNYPVIYWAFAGMGIGAMTGSIVLWKKYQLKFQWCLITILPFFLLLTFLQVSSTPLLTITPRPLTAAVDSSRNKAVDTLTPLKVKLRKRHAIKINAAIDTAKPAIAECVSRLAIVSINARADSVLVYYRTAAYQHGPWSSWRSKFIPQQGQFQLTEDKPVTANSLQYYYETKAILTRSAQNPYTRLLCEGQLVIDTY